MILDTNIIIEKVKKNEEIEEDITVISVIEYPVILDYKKFKGKIINLNMKDILVAIVLQKELRRVGKPKDIANLLIASICINRNEKLITKDNDFLDIKEAAEKLGLNFEVEIK